MIKKDEDVVSIDMWRKMEVENVKWKIGYMKRVEKEDIIELIDWGEDLNIEEVIKEKKVEVLKKERIRKIREDFLKVLKSDGIEEKVEIIEIKEDMDGRKGIDKLMGKNDGNR